MTPPQYVTEPMPNELHNCAKTIVHFVMTCPEGGGDHCRADADLYSDTSSAMGDSVSGRSVGARSQRSCTSSSQRSTTSSKMSG